MVPFYAPSSSAASLGAGEGSARGEFWFSLLIPKPHGVGDDALGNFPQFSAKCHRGKGKSRQGKQFRAG